MEENKKDGNKDFHVVSLLLFIFLFCIIAVIFLLQSQSAEATDVWGDISSDTTWNASGNPYTIKNDIYVNKGVSLYIEPGVEIKFDGFYELDVEGNLIAVGNETQKITFTSNYSNPSVGDWAGIWVIEGYAYIDNCEISYSSTGIAMHCSPNNSVLNTSISKCRNGIYLLDSSGANIFNVQFWEILYQDLYPHGTEKGHFEYSIADCKVNGKPIYYYFNIHDVTIERLEAGRIIVAGSDNVTIKNCNVTNGSGISLYAVTNSTISNCNTSYNSIGILLRKSPDNIYENNSINNIITDNTIYNNPWGIQLFYSEGNEITDNNIISNEWGIYPCRSYRNWIYHNNFVYNDDQVYINIYTESGEDKNFWDNGAEGNYWSDYTGKDLDGNGIGDTRYWVYLDSYDYFPLISPWNGSLPPDTVPPHFTITPRVNLHTMTLPKTDLCITFETSEVGYYEIIVGTDGVEGFNNLTDTTVIGNTTGKIQHEYWEGFDNEGNYVEDGEYQIQIMIWDLAGNPIDESYDIGTITTVKDIDEDGVRDSEDAFPDDPREWSDLDGDGIGDNKDIVLDVDGVSNHDDHFPKDKSEWVDTDGDGIGDNADIDDNDNGIPDIAEIPMVLLILLIPVVAIYHTQERFVEKKKENQVEEKREEKVE